MTSVGDCHIPEHSAVSCIHSVSARYCSAIFTYSHRHYIHCKKGKAVLTQFGYLSFLLTVCIVKHSGAPLPTLDKIFQNISKCN